MSRKFNTIHTTKKEKEKQKRKPKNPAFDQKLELFSEPQDVPEPSSRFNHPKPPLFLYLFAIVVSGFSLHLSFSFRFILFTIQSNLPMSEHKLRKIIEHNRRLKEQLELPRIPVSQASDSLIAFTQNTKDYLLPSIWGPPPHDPFASQNSGGCGCSVM